MKYKRAPNVESQLAEVSTQPAKDALAATVSSLQMQNVDAEVISLALAEAFFTHMRATYAQGPWKPKHGFLLNLTDIVGSYCSDQEKKLEPGWARTLFTIVVDEAAKFREKRWPSGDAWKQMFYRQVLAERDTRGEC